MNRNVLIYFLKSIQRLIGSMLSKINDYYYVPILFVNSFWSFFVKSTTISLAERYFHEIFAKNNFHTCTTQCAHCGTLWILRNFCITTY